MDPELIRLLPKNDLHVHLDGSLRLPTVIDLARSRRVALPSETQEGLRELVFRPHYKNLAEYLEGFTYTVAVLQDAEALERAACELAEDSQAEGVRYLEVRFAPQLHVRPGFEVADVVRAVDRGLRRATASFNARPQVASGEEPRFVAGIILCSLRFFNPQFSVGYERFFKAMAEAPDHEVYTAASVEVARAAARLKHEEGLLVVGVDLAGQEKGYPAEDHQVAYQVAHEAFLGKTVHAGEDYGPESIFQAIGDLHADRVGHGTWLFDESKITSPRIRDRKAYVERLAEFIADKRITIEVCLTSNQQTVPELADDLGKHPFVEMRRRRLSTTFCTDNRLVSNTTVSQEIARAVEAFGLTPREVRDMLIYGFKRSFFPGTYLEKRIYVREIIDFADRVMAGAGLPAKGGGAPT
ncbi:MAG TPA: adenosine deaminase family protein [Vicinamibacteria bacterium]|nr:adenosine deaminase family protein [Vicinamibacteria bacterium]